MALKPMGAADWSRYSQQLNAVTLNFSLIVVLLLKKENVILLPLPPLSFTVIIRSQTQYKTVASQYITKKLC